MNKQTKILLTGLLILSSVLVASAAIKQYVVQPNDYFVYLSEINDMQGSTIDENMMNVSYTAHYIVINGGTTYHNDGFQITTTFNLSQPGQLQTLIKADVKTEAIKRGYNIKKILIPNYNILNP